jgi:probable DNA metabolism protein
MICGNTSVKGYDEFQCLVNEAICRETGSDEQSLKKNLLDFEWQFGKPKNIEKLSKFVIFASRYEDDKSLIYNVIIQAMKFGPDYVLDKCSPESVQFIRRYREVVREYGKFIAHSRFQRFNNTLISEAKAKYNIIDLLLRYFKARYRDKKIVLLNKNKAYIANGGTYTINRDEFLEQTKIKLKREDPLWDIYYNSQFISNRRNKRLAMSRMPKKHSPDFEKHYIEFGIQETKLTNFIF